MSITRVFLFLTLLTYTLGLYLPDKEVSDSEVDPSTYNEEEGLRFLMGREARLSSSEEQRQNAAKAMTEPSYHVPYHTSPPFYDNSFNK